jgi:hypothetical protein
VLPKAHIDVRNVLTGLGIKGGLKKCEARYGVSRGDHDRRRRLLCRGPVAGIPAPGRSGHQETLLAYNAADVLALPYCWSTP